MVKYLTDDSSEDKENTNKCFTKWKLKFENCRNYLKATQLENKINCLEKK